MLDCGSGAVGSFAAHLLVDSGQSLHHSVPLCPHMGTVILNSFVK